MPRISDLMLTESGSPTTYFFLDLSGVDAWSKNFRLILDSKQPDLARMDVYYAANDGSDGTCTLQDL